MHDFNCITSNNNGQWVRIEDLNDMVEGGIIRIDEYKLEKYHSDTRIIKFTDIKEENISIHFNTHLELQKLIDYLKILEYVYGTGSDNDLGEIKRYNLSYFTKNNQYLSLDRSKRHSSRKFVSCGRGYKDTCYEFKDIDWNIC